MTFLLLPSVGASYLQCKMKYLVEVFPTVGSLFIKAGEKLEGHQRMANKGAILAIIWQFLVAFLNTEEWIALKKMTSFIEWLIEPIIQNI